MAAASSDNATVEEVIKRRLLIDGEGMGDERKLNSLIKSYITFVDGEDTEENDVIAFRRLIAQTKQMEYVVRRANASIKVNQEAQEIYTELKDKVQSEIKETKKELLESKLLLEEATKHRKYSMEYDALAKLIESEPDRKLTDLKRMGLELELDTLNKRKAKVVHKLDYRKDTVSMMGTAIERLKDLLAADDAVAAAPKKIVKASQSRNGNPRNVSVVNDTMDVDSTSQSEPPSPLEECGPDIVSGSASTEPKQGSSGTASGVPPNALDTSNSEKYEDLSESEGEENS